MKHLITLAYILTLTAATSIHARADESAFKPLSEAPKSAEEEFFKVTKGEAKVEGHIIKILVIKPDYITASYKNDSKKSIYPKYTVKTYNRYGYLLGGEEVGVSLFGGSSRLEVGDVGGEKIHLDIVNITEIFKHTLLNLPDDFLDVAWVSLADTNTRLVKPDAEKPASSFQSESEGNDKSQPESE